MNKSKLRKYYLNLRKNIIDADDKSKIIVEKILNSQTYKDNKIVTIPVVINESEMIFCKIKSLSDLINFNKYNIKEPLINNNIIEPQKLELVIVPGICFDENKNRIGYGKGIMIDI